MSANINEKKFDPELNEQGVAHHEALDDKDLLQASYEAETRENEMGVLEAVKTHPMACFWAFVFCFTIVGYLSPELMATANGYRSWNRLTCSSTVTSSH